jgi:Flp pilus assembly protein TadD
MNLSPMKRIVTGIPACLALIVLVSVFVYGRIFNFPFVFDSIGHLVRDSVIRDLFRNFEWRLLLVPRNVVNLTLALNYRIGGFDVFGYHLVNLAVHVLSGFMVFFLSAAMLERLSPPSPGAGGEEGGGTRRLVALFAALVFVAHPIQTQAVTYTIQRYTSMAALFYLSSLFFYLKARTPGPEGGGRIVFLHYGLFALSAVLAFLSKQNAASLPLAVLAVEYFFVDRTGKGWLGKIPWIILGFALWAAFVFLSLGVFDSLSGKGVLEDLARRSVETELVGRWTYLFTQFNVLVEYLRLFVFPAGQSVDYIYPFHRTFFSGWTPLAFLFLLVLLGAAAVLRKRLPVLSFGILWFFITLSVESSIFPIRDALFEHRLYLPLFGFAFALSDGVFRIFRRREIAAVVLLAILVTALAVAAHARNEVWRDGIALWTDVLAKNPRNVRGWNNLATVLADAGRMEEAKKALDKAFEIKPDYELGRANLATILLMENEPARAEEVFLAVLKQSPSNLRARTGLGEALRKEGRLEEAAAQFEEVLRLNPSEEKAAMLLAEIRSTRGERGEAEKELAELMKKDSGDASVLTAMGNMKRKAGDREGAVRYYREAVEADPRAIDARVNLAAVMTEEKRYDDAERLLVEVTRIDPGHGKARSSLGAVYLVQGKIPEARLEFEAALRIDGENGEALFNLAALAEGEGNLAAAADFYGRALKVNPRDWEASQNLGGILLSAGDFKGARKWFETSLETHPRNALLQNRLAILLAREGDFGGARVRYEKAMEIDPGLKPVVQYNLACLESLRNRRDAAFLSLEEAFRAGYRNCRNARTDPDLENVRNHPGFPGLMKKYCAGEP